MNTPVCPRCGKSAPDQDYCPVHGARLVRQVATSTPTVTDPPSAANSSSMTSPLSATDPPPVTDTPPPRKESTIEQVLSRLGFRRPASKVLPTAEILPDLPSPLPEAVREKGWQVDGPVRSSAGIDQYPVQRTTDDGDSVAGHFNIFRNQALTRHAIYKRLENSVTPRLARVWDHGTVAFWGNSRADFELVSLPKVGIPLNKWLADSSPSENRALHLFPLLAELLQELSKSDVLPLAFEPAQLMLDNDNDLWLMTAAMLAERSATPEFRPELGRNALLPYGWSAFEMTNENMHHSNSVVFSVGQVLAQALWGQPCSMSELQTGTIPFQAISDARLANVLMGCLWPIPTGRWSIEHLLQATLCSSAEAMPATPPWDSLVPGASFKAFSFNGRAFWRLETLLAAAVKPPHWDEAITRIDDILAWTETTCWAGHAKVIHNALHDQGRSADWALVALTRKVCPDLPLTFRELDLSDEEAAQSLIGLAQRALRNGKTDLETMRALFKADLRGAFTHPQ